MITLFAVGIMLFMLLTSFRAITAKSLVDSVLFFSFTGLGATILFALMKAPDVALTEAAIGTGIVTLVFLSALRRTYKEEKHDEE